MFYYNYTFFKYNVILSLFPLYAISALWDSSIFITANGLYSSLNFASNSSTLEFFNDYAYFALVISKKTKYAINALVHLAKKKDEGPILISEIAESEHIPQKFLEAILLELKKAGVLASKKGKGGGYYMTKSPEDIHVAEVMRLFDGPIALLPCVTYMYYERCEECKDEETCGIRDIFLEVRNKTVDLLKGATLEEIIKREQQGGKIKE